MGFVQGICAWLKRELSSYLMTGDVFWSLTLICKHVIWFQVRVCCLSRYEFLMLVGQANSPVYEFSGLLPCLFVLCFVIFCKGVVSNRGKF